MTRGGLLAPPLGALLAFRCGGFFLGGAVGAAAPPLLFIGFGSPLGGPAWSGAARPPALPRAFHARTAPRFPLRRGRVRPRRPAWGRLRGSRVLARCARPRRAPLVARPRSPAPRGRRPPRVFPAPAPLLPCRSGGGGGGCPSAFGRRGASRPPPPALGGPAGCRFSRWCSRGCRRGEGVPRFWYLLSGSVGNFVSSFFRVGPY